MTSPTANTTPTACPRCRSGPIGILGKSPVAGVWTIFGCSTCLYAWRSSEPEENVNPDKYPAAFRLRPEDLPNLAVVPPVRPGRSTS
jgi:vanillate/4-hydroxybenzoate decarboxylase subunit D